MLISPTQTRIAVCFPYFLLVSILFASSATTANAQRYWDTNGPTPGVGATTTQSIPGNFWSASATGESTTGSFTFGEQAIFTGTAGDVNLTGNFAPSGIAIQVSGYSFRWTGLGTPTINSSITLADSVNFTLVPHTSASSGQITINGNITGGSSLTLVGNQTSGNTGTIALGGTAPNINVPTVNISGPGSGFVGFNTTVTGATISSNVVNNTSSRFLLGATTSGNFLTYSGAISGSGGVSFSTGTSGGAGVIVLTGGNSDYTGATAINMAQTGVVRLGVNNGLSTATALSFRASGGTSGGAFDLAGFNQSIASLTNDNSSNVRGIVNSGATTSTLTITGNANTTYKSTIGTTSGNANLTNLNTNIALTLAASHSGNLRLEGANTYTGGTNILGGTLTIGGNSVLATAGPVTIGGGTFDTLDKSFTVGLITLSGGEITGTAGTLTGSAYQFESGTLSKVLGGSGALTKSTNGTVSLNAQALHTGGTSIEAGILQLNVANALHHESSVVVEGGTLSLGEHNNLMGPLTMTSGALLSSTGVLTSPSYQMHSGSVDAILHGTSNLTKSSPGTVVMSRLNTYSGITAINEGTLSINTLFDGGVPSSIGESASIADRLQFGGGTLQYTGIDTSTDRNATLNSSGGEIEITDISTTVDWTGSFTGPGALTKSGPGTLRLTNISTHAGGTVLDGGKLILDYAGLGSALGSGPLEILSGSLEGAGVLPSPLMIQPQGTLAPGSSIGTLSIAADVTLAGTLEIELNGENAGSVDLLNGVQHLVLSDSSKIDFTVLGLDPLNDPAYVFANYTSLSGTFSSKVSLPDGYKIDYEFEGNQIALVPVPEPSGLRIVLGLATAILAHRRRSPFCRSNLRSRHNVD